jgi:cell wall-associated NlpC family hydrolase
MTNTERAPWQRYLGLPYQWGGDPDRDGGTDCLGITWRCWLCTMHHGLR